MIWVIYEHELQPHSNDKTRNRRRCISSIQGSFVGAGYPTISFGRIVGGLHKGAKMKTPVIAINNQGPKKD